MDYRLLLKRYMFTVCEDDSFIGERCAANGNCSPSSKDGDEYSPEELAELRLILEEVRAERRAWEESEHGDVTWDHLDRWPIVRR